MLNIYTHTKKIFSKEYLKYTLAKFTGRNRGPLAVANSLVRGLKELNVEYRINPRYSTLKATDVVHVISGIQAAKDLIALRKKGRIKRLTAGPNLTLAPHEENSLYMSPEIEKILFPSEWPKNYFVEFDKIFNEKIDIWPAGVKDPGTPKKPVKSRDFTCLLYIKNSPIELIKKIQDVLLDKKIPTTILEYGKFNQKEFFSALEKVAFMIYVSPTESQGLALHEAWMRDIPTLVWNRGYWEYKGHTVYFDKISAPYLTPACGIFFKNSHEFRDMLEYFHKIRDHFEPRAYNLSKFTDALTASIFLKKIEKTHEKITTEDNPPTGN
ncbi:MAG: hypothetical protein K9M11_04150 [Candidatus Pacebacteria bacterium]|nr:hypothetical protein [Candidatus Paceibacterota bacterium]